MPKVFIIHKRKRPLKTILTLKDVSQKMRHAHSLLFETLCPMN